MSSPQLKGLVVSVLIHGAVLAALLLGTQWGPPPSPPLRIDFSIAAAPPAPPPAPPPVEPRVVSPPPPPPKQVEIEPPKAMIAAVQPMISIPSEDPPERKVVAEPPPAPPVTPIESSDPPPPSGPITATGRTASSPAVGPAATTEPDPPAKAATAQEYLKAHFLYIKEDIQQNILYPRMARRMGWEGRVVVSFIIHEDGTVDQIKIVESSGFALLDQNAIESIKKTAPFPQPPARAELVVPISYRLG